MVALSVLREEHNAIIVDLLKEQRALAGGSDG
jgi:hypothetical protein